MKLLYPLRHPRRVYCAGPLFNAAERGEMIQIAAVLAGAGFEPFVPHADGMEFAQVLPVLAEWGYDEAAAGAWLHAAIFALDTYQVCEGCGSLVFNMNGRVPDEGAVAEATMAWMLGKPVVLFKDDARSAIAGRDNPLVIGPARFETVDELARLPEVLAARLAACPTPQSWQVPCALHLAETLAAGAGLWQALSALEPPRDAAAVARLVLDQFGPGAAAGDGRAAHALRSTDRRR